MNDADVRKLIQPDHGLSQVRHDNLKEQLLATILSEQHTTETAPTNLGKRRLSKILVGTAIAAIAVGGVAAAGSLFPDDTSLLPVGECRTESSIQEVVATIQMSNGNTLQLFTTRADSRSPINGHALIQTTPDGQDNGGSSGCNPPGTPDGRGNFWAVTPGESGPDGTVIWVNGRAPEDAARVEVDLSDGDTVDIGVQTDGYFLTEIFRPDITSGADNLYPPVPQPSYIRAFDSDGVLIAEQAT